MARTVNSLRGIASGAGTGAALGSIIPGVGTAIGAGVGATIGLVSGLVSPSDEEVRSQRISELVKKYNEMRNKALAEGTQKISKQTTGAKSQNSAAIARRAGAAGASVDEANILTSNRNVDVAGANAIEDFVLNTNNKYDDLIANAEYQGAAAPIEPNAVDVLETISGPAMQYAQNSEYLNTLKTLGGVTGTKPSVDSILPPPGNGITTVQPGGGTGMLLNGTGPSPSNLLSLGETGSLIPKRKYNGRVNAMVN